MKVGSVWALVGAALLLPGLAAGAPIPGSTSQVGPWKVGGYTRNQTTAFDHCAIYRVQNEGFGIAITYNARGALALGMESPGWNLQVNDSYTGKIQVGTQTYVFTGKGLGAHGMAVNVAPELFNQLKTGRQLTAQFNDKSYTISLDGIEAAGTRMKECVRQYGGSDIPMPSVPAGPGPQAGSSAGMPPAPPPPGGGGTPAVSPQLVAQIQTLLARLGYDPGPANGVLTVRTNMAISAFQKSIGERGDGLPSEAVRMRLEKAIAEKGPAAAQPKGVASTGTGFYVSPDTVVTNFHVVNGCTALRLKKNGGDLGNASVVASSRADDLAALRAERRNPNFLKLRTGAPIKAAEPVLVFGYPLAEALSSAGNTTLGNVTALAGMRDDTRYLQISAAVQPGNSGGPAIDEGGRVMGVVVAKLNALAVARITGDIPQNINFAIKASTLQNFLEANRLKFEGVEGTVREVPATERAERAEAGSLQIECIK